MKSITYCIALSLAVAATSLPSSGSLSNLDRKYGTNKGTPRKASNTTTRKKSSTVRRDTKPEARPAAQPAVRLSTEEMLQRTSSLLQAWVNKDGQTLRALAGDKTQLLLLWNSSEVVQTGKDDFASQMLRTPEEIRAGYKISGIKIINAQEQGILAQMDFGVGGAIPEGFIIVMFDSSGCISQLAMAPGKTTDGVINASNRAAFIDLPNVGFSSEAPYGAAANNGDGAAANQPRTGHFTWGGVNEEYDQDPKYKEALETTLDELPNLEYKLYHYLRHDPKTAMSNAKLLPFADEIYLLGLGKTVSPEEFCEIANSGKAKWPADAEPTYEPDDIRGGVFTFTADIPMMGSHEPACILVTLLLNKEGKICGIGETELTESGEDGQATGQTSQGGEGTVPAMDAEFFSIGGVDTDYSKDPLIAKAEKTSLPIQHGNSVHLSITATWYANAHTKTGAKMYEMSPHSMDAALKFAPQVALLGHGKTLSRDEVFKLITASASQWPDNTKPIKYAAKGACLEFVTRFNVPASDKPVYVKTVMVFNSYGEIIGIGETRCDKMPPDTNPAYQSFN